MEPADIDWRRVESRFVLDEAFEHIHAPKWADLSAPPDADDVAWFCRPDCRHPCTAEDFLAIRGNPSPQGKLMRSASAFVSSGDRDGGGNIRENNTLKRRVGAAASSPRRGPSKPKAADGRFEEDGENRNPNMVTPPPAAKSRPFGAPWWGKNSLKPVMEEKEDLLGKKVDHPQQPKQLKSTLSARNLFSGKDILSQLSDFYDEIKKMAVGGPSHTASCDPGKEKEETNPTTPIKGGLSPVIKESAPTERWPSMLKEVRASPQKPPQRRKPSVVINSSSVLKDVRASPPTPQRFSPSVNRVKRAGAAVATMPAAQSPLKRPPFRPTPERGTLKEVVESDAAFRQDGGGNCSNAAAASHSNSGGGASGSMFWFLKPCTFLVE